MNRFLSFFLSALLFAGAANAQTISGGVLTGGSTNSYQIWGVYDIPDAGITPGTGYVPADQITLSIPSATAGSWQGYAAAVVNVYETKVVSATVNAGGASCGGSSATITGTTGTAGTGATLFSGTVAVSGGAITGPITITVPGGYTANPTSLTGEPVTGDSCVGATVNLTMGVYRTFPGNAGYYTQIAALSGNTVTQTSTTGVGTGFAATASFAPYSVGIIPQSQNGTDPFGNTSAGYKALFANSNTYSTAFGYKALFQATNHANEAFGAGAGAAVTTAVDNVFVGADAGNNDDTGTGITGVDNTGIGTHALGHLTSGGFNTALGSDAMVGCGNWVGQPSCTLTGGNNTAVGGHALWTIQGAAASNVAVGYAAGIGITTGSSNTIIGANVSPTTLTTGSQNVLVGTGTTTDTVANGTTGAVGIGQNVIPGTNDVCIGHFACTSHTTDTDTITAVGGGALQHLTGGIRNVAIGTNALTTLTTGQKNTAVGTGALTTDSTGSSNTALGFNSGFAATGAGGTFIGYQAGLAVTGANNTILGGGVATTTPTTGARNIMIGTGVASDCELSSTGTNDTFILCSGANSTPIVTANLATGPTGYQWQQQGLFAKGSNGAVSAAGTSSQSAATALTANINNVTTVAANAGVALPACTGLNVGAAVRIYNFGANTLLIWPVNGGSDSIDGLSANTNTTLSTTNRGADFVCTVANKWRSNLIGAVSS